MKKRQPNRKQIFLGAYYAVDEDFDSRERSVLFTQDRTMDLIRFALLETERDRYSDEKYINDWISLYHRDRARFSNKRKVTKARAIGTKTTHRKPDPGCTTSPGGNSNPIEVVVSQSACPMVDANAQNILAFRGANENSKFHRGGGGASASVVSPE